MGILALKKDDVSNKYDILDGQQRMTTLIVLGDYLCDLIRMKNDKYKKGIIKIEQLNVHQVENIFEANSKSKENSRSKEKYKEVYNFFASLYANSGEINPEELIQVIENRLFWLINFWEGDKHEVFEGINATGKPLEYADLLLNYLLERNHDEGTKITEEEIKYRWDKILNNIYKSELLESSVDIDIDSLEENILYEKEIEEDEDKETIERNIVDNLVKNRIVDENVESKQTIKKPLKLKKFLSAIHCLTLPKTESLSELVEDFEKIFIRLKEFTQGEELSAKSILDSMEYWGELYLMCIEPISNTKPQYKEIEEELYYLNILGNANYIPMTLRVLDKFKRNVYKSDVVKSILGAVVRYKIYSEIYIERNNSNEAEKKIILLDYIVDALIKKQKINIEIVFSVVNQDKNAYNNILSDYDCCQTKELGKVRILKYPYNSKISKLILAIDYKENHGELLLNKENKDNLFQVEHMVARIVDRGYFQYGFDDISVNEFYNLMLLEKDINIGLGSKRPLDKLKLKDDEKYKCWTDSVLYDYYKDYINKSIKEPNFMIGQTERMVKLVKALCNYLHNAFPKDTEESVKKEELYFLQANRYYGQYIGITSNISIDSSTANTEKYLFALIDGKIERYPQTKKNNTIDYYFSIKGIHGRASNFIKEEIGNQSSDKKRYGLFLFVQCMMQLIKNKKQDAKAEQDVYDIITSFSITKGKGGTKSGEILFTDSNVRNRDIKIDTRMKDYINNENLKYKLLDGKRYICFNINTDANVTVDGLKHIYKLYQDITKKSFGYWIEMAEPEMHYINGIRRFIPFRNIGNEELFTEFVKKWLKEKKASDVQTYHHKKDDSDSSSIESYFKCKNQEFKELTNKEFNIPIYQRNYVWDESNHESLWNSITDTISNDKDLNLGTIILYGNSIVDGQQRLTTLGILYKLLTQENDVKLYSSLFCGNNNVKNDARKYYEKKIQGLEEKERFLNALEKIQLSVLEIDEKSPKIYQYVVFSAVNGKGKKLTVQEKVKNLILKRFSKEVELDNVKLISETEGFIKAFIECKRTRHIAESELYNEFKKWIYEDIREFKDLLNNCKYYRFIKGMTNSKNPDFINKSTGCNEKYKKFIINLRLYQQLNVNTADALILYHFANPELKLEHATNLLHRLNVLYFHLYVDDPNGNGKKSINSKLSELIKLNSVEIFAKNKIYNGPEKYIIIDAIFYVSNNITEYIWNKILAMDLTRNIRANVSRFILMFVELWMGMNTEIAYEILETERNKRNSILDKSDLEHIFPANPDSFPGNLQSPQYLYKLENVCLLEEGINRSVKNAMLSISVEKENDKTKLGKYGSNHEILDEDKKYKDSIYFMPQMFYKGESKKHMNNELVFIKDNIAYYTEIMASNRIKRIKEIIDAKGLFKEDINLIRS